MNKALRHLASDKSFEYQIKRQRRKTIALHVLADGTVEVRTPKWVPKYELTDFVEQRSEWVVERRREVLKALANQPTFSDGQYHKFLGDNFPLCVTMSGRSGVEFKDGVILVKVRDTDDPDQVSKALERWYREKAIEIYEERVFACFESFPEWFQDKYVIPEITVRKMRRRWGSCSRSGDVTLNLTLIKMPVQSIDYVIVHELCHLEAFHHGKAFYRLLALVMPSWKEQEKLIEQLS
ncbi:MAG: SprT family zinc-dependent metalloprotease [Oceanicoccus sp.]